MRLDELAGHRLAADAVSDIDSPPFDKAMMDGVAVRSADLANGPRELVCRGELLAGSSPDSGVGDGEAIRIMTGAAIPPGADAVIMIEQTRWPDERTSGGFYVEAESCNAGQNIMRRGTAMSAGQTVLTAGHLVRPSDVGILAESGAAQCQAIPRPILSVVATGNELVPADTVPRSSQIRNSNGPMLAAMARGWCREVNDPGICRDDVDQLREAITRGLESDVLVLSGGVSAGVADLVPGVLAWANVEEVFHKVSIKPGKPIWFGVLPRDGERYTLVFGLPGNPVSSLCCFHVFVRPALEILAGGPGTCGTVDAALDKDHEQRTGRTVYWPSRLHEANGWRVEPLDWKGSADLLTLASAQGFAVFPGDRTLFPAGERIQVVPFDNR